MSFFPGSSNKRTSFPELVGQNVRQAAAFIAAQGTKYRFLILFISNRLFLFQGLTPVLVKPNQPMTMDYRTDRVRIVTDPSGRVVSQVPTVG